MFRAYLGLQCILVQKQYCQFAKFDGTAEFYCLEYLSVCNLNYLRTILPCAPGLVTE